MMTIHTNHQSATTTILANLSRYLRERFHEADCTTRATSLIVDLSASRSQFRDVDTTASAIRVSPSKILAAIIDRLDIILRRRDDIAITICNLGISYASITQDTTAGKEFLLNNQILDILITATDSSKPFIKGFVIMLVFIMPNINSKFIRFTKPLFYCHQLIPPNLKVLICSTRAESPSIFMTEIVYSLKF